jgi:hypothetical protein
MAGEGLEAQENKPRPQSEAASLPINGLGSRDAPLVEEAQMMSWKKSWRCLMFAQFAHTSNH